MSVNHLASLYRAQDRISEVHEVKAPRRTASSNRHDQIEAPRLLSFRNGDYIQTNINLSDLY